MDNSIFHNDPFLGSLLVEDRCGGPGASLLEASVHLSPIEARSA
jgi:hypothetical protein